MLFLLPWIRHEQNSYYYPFAFAYKEVELTEKPTIAKTEKTTKPKTTEAKAVKTTSKPKTTSKVTTTKQAATEKIKTTSAKKSESKTVVYFYEKEVLISQVYVTDTPTQTSVINAKETTTAVASTELAQDNLEMADKIAVQKIICAVGGVILIAFAAWAGLSAKKKHSENDNSAQKDDELNNDEK